MHSLFDCGLAGSIFPFYDKEKFENGAVEDEGAHSLSSNENETSDLNCGFHGRYKIEEAPANQLSGCGRKRAVLSNQQAVAIFDLRVPFYDSVSETRNRAFTSRSIVVSRMFGVSPKAVRDIWNKRTWRHCTQKMWTDEDSMPRPNQLKSADAGAQHSARPNGGSDKPATARRVGRPRGSKDSKPRRPRHEKRYEAATFSPSSCLPRNPWPITDDDSAEPACSYPHAPAAPAFDRFGTAHEVEGRSYEAEAAPAARPAEPAGEAGGLRSAFPFFLGDSDRNNEEEEEEEVAQEPRYYWSARL